MIKRHYLIQFWILFVLFVLTLGVSFYEITERRDIVKRHLQKVKKKTKQVIERIPQLKPVERFAYPEEVARPSPFLPRKLIVLNKGLGPDPNRPREPLESYNLDSLKFSGVLEEGPRRWALIMIPEGKIFRVKVGSYMGKNDGKVVAVTENSLMIEERVLDPNEVWVKRPVTFRLDTIIKPGSSNVKPGLKEIGNNPLQGVSTGKVR